GYLSVNYVGLVPILIEAVKELKAEISELQTKRAPSAFDSPELQTAVLYQNAPNPFSQTTEIRYYLSETVKTAYLTVYDMQGKQLKRYDLATRGAGSQTVLGSEFAAGMYLYALIADGQEVDVKRMILTE
ncbi:MAG: T9SS type A sorting domain-containing protein, partial [Candidatus Symbiothrix sp.]|nr:T9SS type A sorting domain-containing protein [Candidatus Symbiothrix sp.]